MRYVYIILLIFPLFYIDCKNKEKDPEPGIVLNRWARALETMNYREYSFCEAYPKTKAVFSEIYRDEYFGNIVVYSISEPDKGKIEKDDSGSFIRCSLEFDGDMFKRSSREPYQNIRGNIDLIKYLDGEKSGQGWLLSNRIITRTDINK